MEICTHIIAFLCRKCYRTWEMSEMFYNYPGSCGILIGLQTAQAALRPAPLVGELALRSNDGAVLYG